MHARVLFRLLTSLLTRKQDATLDWVVSCSSRSGSRDLLERFPSNGKAATKRWLPPQASSTDASATPLATPLIIQRAPADDRLGTKLSSRAPDLGRPRCRGRDRSGSDLLL